MALAALVLLVGLCGRQVAAAIQTFCPSGADQLCYSISVPQETVANNGTGDLYLQLAAPTSYQWVAMGYGTEMAGSNMFIVYADGAGNVTVSPRTCTGHVEPVYNADAKLTLLEGSGVVSGKLIANFKCSGSDCGTTIDVSSAASNWIAAWKLGSSLDSTQLDQTIAEHSSYATFRYNLTTAIDSSSTNPFTAAPVATSSSSGATEVSADNEITYLEIGHGLTMGLAFAALFPLGVVALTSFGLRAHMVLQLISTVLIWIGLVSGVVLAQHVGELFNQTHTILGTAIVCLLLVQPVLGWWHHRRYVQTQQRSAVTYAHRWYGRVLLVLGIVNGGLGLQLAGNTTAGTVVYALVAAVCGLAWFAKVAYKNIPPKFTKLSDDSTVFRQNDRSEEVLMQNMNSRLG